MALEIEFRQSGMIYGCPSGQHDDLAISCAMLTWAAQHPHLEYWTRALEGPRPPRNRRPAPSAAGWTWSEIGELRYQNWCFFRASINGKSVCIGKTGVGPWLLGYLSPSAPFSYVIERLVLLFSSTTQWLPRRFGLSLAGPHPGTGPRNRWASAARSVARRGMGVQPPRANTRSKPWTWNLPLPLP